MKPSVTYKVMAAPSAPNTKDRERTLAYQQQDHSLEIYRTRIFLITPEDYDPVTFAPLLDSVLNAGDVASVLLMPSDKAPYADTAKELVPIIQARGAAALIHNDSQIMGRTQADGLLLDSDIEQIVETVKAHAGRQIMGVANILSRHDAMVLGEGPVDFLFFGRLDGDTKPDIFPKSFKLAEWWSQLFQIPAVVMGGQAIESAAQASDEGIDFVALRDAIWKADDPADALAKADAAIDHSFEERKAFLMGDR